VLNPGAIQPVLRQHLFLPCPGPTTHLSRPEHQKRSTSRVDIVILRTVVGRSCRQR
jgi:hypothetical protein